MKDVFSVSRLIIKKKLKSLTEPERIRLKQFKKEYPFSKKVDFDVIVQKLSHYSKMDNDIAWESLMEKYNRRHSRSFFSNTIRPFLPYAAVFLCLLGVAYYFANQQQQQLYHIPKDAITLQLENGNINIIQDNGTQEIVDSEGKILGVQKGDQIVYEARLKSNELEYNTLKIPYGKRFQVVLSDGTKIHLNSGSTLKYPIQFSGGKQRVVSLTGEAFFDVAKDKLHPFIVQLNDVNVKVLGTKFNVTSYDEEKVVNTVLVEGSVEVANNNNEKQKSLISPGEKASWSKVSKDISVNKVDVSTYTAWTDGQLVFKGVSFREICQKLERAYGVSIVVNDLELENEVFSASFNVDLDSVESVLYYIGKSHPFTFTQRGRKIVINKPLKKDRMK